MTRRNITEHKISSNILNHNSPIGVQNFDSLNLGPQLPRHKRFASSFTHADAQGGDSLAGRSHPKPGSLGYFSAKSGKPRLPQEFNPTKVGPKVYPLPFGPPLN